MEEQKNISLLPTNKEHISFSELKDWIECSYKHKLKHVIGPDESTDNVYSCFGTAIHESCEDFVKTRVMKIEIGMDIVRQLWKENNFQDCGLWMTRAKNILEYLPGWLEKTFPGWQPVCAEEELLEIISEKHQNIKFKGFIDLIIKYKNKIYILDYKTSSLEGWSDYKRKDEIKNLQLIYYNIFWSRKHNLDRNDIQCAFLLLNRETGFGARTPIELFEIDINEPQRKKSLDIIDNMIFNVKKGIAFKAVKNENYGACKFCEYNETSKCW